MIKDFVISVISVAFLSIVCELIVPDGNLKKYYKLVMGFIMMCVLVKPITNIKEFPEFEFSINSTMSEEELEAAGNAYVLKIHEDNIKNKIHEVCTNQVEVFVNLYSDGRVKSVNIKGNVPADKIAFLKKELGCENIEVENYE